MEGNCFIFTSQLNDSGSLIKRLKISKGGVFRSRNSKKGKQCNGQKKNVNRTNNDLKAVHRKLKIEKTRTPLKTWCEIWCSGILVTPVRPVVLLLNDTNVIGCGNSVGRRCYILIFPPYSFFSPEK
jgi:hypothetical protein